MNESVASDIAKVILYYRLGVDAEGSDALAKVMEALQPRLAKNLSILGPDDMAFLKSLMQAQAASDYLYVADLMEFALPQTALVRVLD